MCRGTAGASLLLWADGHVPLGEDGSTGDTQWLTERIARAIGFLPLFMYGIWGTFVPRKVRYPSWTAQHEHYLWQNTRCSCICVAEIIFCWSKPNMSTSLKMDEAQSVSRRLRIVLVQASIYTGNPSCCRLTGQHYRAQCLKLLILAALSQGRAQITAWMNGFLRCISVVAAGQADNGDREAH